MPHQQPRSPGVGRTLGFADVTASGEATYTVPIVVPPGINGLTPEIALSYGHRTAEGLAGVGWSVSGISAIARCTATAASNATLSEVRLAVTDRYCLDGNQLKLDSGTYGTSGSTYRTEVDMMARITAMSAAGNGPAWFKVESKDGLIYEYGNTADSRIESLASGYTTTARVWALNKIEDRAGNGISFSYIEDGAPYGSYRIDRISYRVNGSAGLSTPGYAIEFEYDPHPTGNVDTSYGAGGVIEDNKLMTTVDVWYEGVTPRTIVRRYNLDYEDSLSSANHSRLDEVEECGTGGSECFAPTTFTYQDGTNNLDTETLSGTTLATGTSPLPIDINGDGRTDLVYPSANTGGTWRYRLATSSGGYGSEVNSGISATNHKYAFPMDHNHDGYEDFLVPYSGTTWWAVHGGTSGLSSPVNTSVTRESTIGNALAYDMDGDGREDLVWGENIGFNKYDGAIYVKYRNSSGYGFSSSSDTLFLAGANERIAQRLSTGSYQQDRNRFYDANGDGYKDIAIVIYELDGETLYRDTYVVLGGFRGEWHVTDSTAMARPIDLNGDGYTDIVYRNDDASGGAKLATRLSTGKSFGSETLGAASANYNLNAAVALDWNGDGFEDLLIPNTSQNEWFVFESDGEALSSSAIDTNIATGSTSLAYRTDSDGDGLSDVAYMKSDRKYAHRLHSGDVPDLLLTVTDGLSNTVEFDYAPMTDSTIYTRHTDAVFPARDFVNGMALTSTLERSDGVGGDFVQTYSYEGMQLDLEGRGLNGFEQRTVTDNRNDIKIVETYHRDYPYRGRVSESEIRLGDSTLVRKATIGWDILTNGTGLEDYHFPYLEESVVETYEAGGTYNGYHISTVSTTYTVDSYGTATTIERVSEEESSANGALSGTTYTQKTQLTNVSNTTGTWCLGKAGTVQHINSHTGPYGGTQITRTTNLDWDLTSLCRIDQIDVEPSDTDYEVTTDLEYDDFGNVDSRTITGTGMTARVSTTDWGTTGQFPTTITNALSHETELNWDLATGDLLTHTDPNNLDTDWEYDEFGRITKETRPDSTYTTISWDACIAAGSYCGTGYSTIKYRARASSKSTSGSEIRYDDTFFDLRDRVVQTSAQSLGGGMANVRTIYDEYGRVDQRSAPDFATTPSHFTTFEHDDLGRLTKISREIDDSTSTLQHTNIYYEGLTSRVVDAESNESKKIRDVLGRVYRSVDDGGYYQQFDYDAFGSLVRTKDSLTNTLNSATYDYGIGAFRVTSGDMDMGDWEYSYNALGELTAYNDANTSGSLPTTATATLEYDALSRIKKRIETEGTTEWTWGNTATSHNIGRLQSVSGPGHSQSYIFDSNGRLSKHTVTSDATYDIDYAFDSSTGLLSSVEYPVSTGTFRLKMLQEYQYGLLETVKRSDGAQDVYWQANAEDAFGNVIDVDLGHGSGQVTSIRGYDAVTGLLDYIESGVGGGSGLQDVEYSWDKVGNLTRREDINRSLEELFYYDDLNRLDYSTLNSTTNLDLTYDAMGNISVKDDVTTSTWTYHSTKKHAVTAAGSNSYAYDSNGNMTTRNGDTITWASYNYPSEIEEGSRTYQYGYDAFRQRYKQVYDNGTETETTYYVGGIFEKNVNDDTGDEIYRHFIYARGEAVAIHARPNGGTAYDRFILRDHQGSIAALLDESGTAAPHQAFSAFGERRDPSDWSGSPSSTELGQIADTSDRGYTDHVQLEGSSLIHMRGRVMDAQIGRFLSPDPFTTEPGNSQNWNRYSYVHNNPLSFTDPSGFQTKRRTCGDGPCYSNSNPDGGGRSPGPPQEDVGALEKDLNTPGSKNGYGGGRAAPTNPNVDDLLTSAISKRGGAVGQSTIVARDTHALPSQTDNDTYWSWTFHGSVSGAFAGYGGEFQIGIHIVLTGSPDIAGFITTASAAPNSLNVMTPGAEGHIGTGNLNTEQLRRSTFDSVNMAVPYASAEVLVDPVTGEWRQVSAGVSTPWSGSGVMTTRPNTRAVGIRDAVIALGPYIDTAVSMLRSGYQRSSDWIRDLRN